ncbi:hypothetical protein DHEL01_v208152 [Diaporthe helianthi]|uniref:BRCT domain-containing protein n=1 Tax=Diaporthe helianthi TaxID=158607 RepID=A0A2P5HT59_DIAHE|nr:hypothetical protein DHEL01_v208152 [Diaporthe helianthi]
MPPDSGENSQLAGVVVCITGNPTCDEDENKHIREQFTDENVSRWLKYRSGKLVEEVTKATTHLVCSRKEYMKRATNDKMNAARKLGCHIVTYEWLTDTLQLLDCHKRKAPPGLYHPGKARDGEAISAVFRKSEKKFRPSKQKALTAMESTSVSGEDDARAGGASKHGPKHSARRGEESTQNSSEKKGQLGSSGLKDSEVIKLIDGIKRPGNPADSKSDKPAGMPKDGAKAENHEPHIDLSRFSIYRDETGPYQVEVFNQGHRHILELYESKSTPKKYLFSIRVYQKSGSSKCDRRFPSKTPRDKDHELERFRSRFWRMSGKRWRQRDSNPNNEKLGKYKKESHPASSPVVPHRQRQVDLKTSFKRKSSFSDNRPAKELKVTKYSTAGESGKASTGESKVA